MKLLLTSKAFGNDIINEKIRNSLEIDIANAKVLFIPTALGGLYGYEKYLPQIIDFGFKEENIIIFNENEADKYKNLDIDVIYTCGGNTFTLLKLFKESGFVEELINYINKGVIYIGRSAGSHLLTKNIEHVLAFDDNDIGLEDYNGLGVFDGVLICHYNEEREQIYQELIRKNGYNVYTLTNDELLLVDETKIKKI